MVHSKSAYKARIVDSYVEKCLGLFGAVSLEGPKWCGKTWTGAQFAESEFLLGTGAGRGNNLLLASTDPSFALAGDAPHLIDEWQEVLPIWDAVRFEVDRRGKKGQFILTGSSTPSIDNLNHSGAGRIKRIAMKTMSLYESGESSGLVSLASLFDGTFANCSCGESSLAKLIYYVVRGGWPGALDVTPEDAIEIPGQYLENLFSVDFQKLGMRPSELSKMRLLMLSLARNESTTASRGTLKKDIQDTNGRTIDEDTISSYMEKLRSFHLLADQLPFSTRIRSEVRIKEMVKHHFVDPSLACALLGATPLKLLSDLETFGFLFEALCERDLSIYASSLGGSLYHYQDYKGNEIDAIVELPDGRYGAFEIKLGENQVDDAATSLKSIEELLDPKPEFLCVLTGMSEAAYKRKDGVYVVPIIALKN